ncbi:hypothetical protein INS49_013205 [Diaporthe citri]|uniref:uncharacterized protein n=1 Tax=Diaporthe citri TaxID=83186 RepID=UPI001C7E41BF|nr:uncharacterized protein INS49_013205 [Diaporthe citri]KAG6359682.1 hypothetical protein INS49_013205 [Diaporthe citri]
MATVSLTPGPGNVSLRVMCALGEIMVVFGYGDGILSSRMGNSWEGLTLGSGSCEHLVPV